MTEHANFKLGKRPFVADPRTFKLANYLAPTLPPIKPRVQWSSKAILPWGMHLNDNEGDCVVAAWANLRILHTSMRPPLIRLTDDQVQALYVTLTGLEGAAFNPVTRANDNGLNMITAIKYLRHAGKILAFLQVDHTNHDHVKFAIDAFEGVYVGSDLPKEAQIETGPGHEWRDVHGFPGTWGGHATFVPDYTEYDTVHITWDFKQNSTWAWWDKYVEECWCLLSVDLADPTHPSPSGFSLDQLKADIALLK